MTLAQALQYVVSGGSVVLVAMFASWAAENWLWFQALATAAKQSLMVGVCLVLALGAWAVQKYVPAATLDDLAAPFGIVVVTIAGLLANQSFHALINKANPPAVMITQPVVLAPGATLAVVPTPGAGAPAQTVAMPLVR
jgi:hypothetical protein